MSDLFRLKIVGKRQVTIPQRLMDLLGVKQGDEIHLKVANGKVLQTYPVRITPDMEMSPDAVQRFDELEREETSDLGDLLRSYDPQEEMEVSHPLSSRFTGSPVRFFNRPHMTRWGMESTCQRVPPMNFKRGDERLQEAVAESLANEFPNLSRIAITAENGEVTLTGTMNDKREKLVAELIARNVLGVTEVHNDIEVDSSIHKERLSAEPVVSNAGRVVEEVRVGKDAVNRSETVKDTVRRTETPRRVEAGKQVDKV